MGWLVAVMLTSVVTTVWTDGHMSLPRYQLEKQVQKAPIVLYGQDITELEACPRTDCPMRRHVLFQVHAALKDGGWMIPENQTILVGQDRRATEQDLTKVPVSFKEKMYVFVTRMNDGNVTYEWFEDEGFSGLHQGEHNEFSDFCGLLADSLDIEYTRCPYMCPEGGFLYSGKCYYAKTTPAATYEEAVDSCEAGDTSVPSLDSGSFTYFKEWFGESFFWLDNSYTGEEDDKPECNAVMDWDKDSIRKGGEGDMIVVREEGYCVWSDGRPTEAMTICYKAAVPYANEYKNMAPSDDHYTMSFEAKDTLYGHCCQETKRVAPTTIEVNFADGQDTSVAGAYILGDFNYDGVTSVPGKQSVVLVFEDSGHRGSRGGQINPYLVYLAVVGEDRTTEHYSFEGIGPRDMGQVMSYNLYVIELDHTDEIQNLENYSMQDCGEDYSGRCFFHLNQFLEDIGGDVTTKINWDVQPDISSIDAMQRKDLDALRRVSDLCEQLYPDFEPYENGLVVCKSPVSGSEGYHSNLTWMLIMALIGYCFVQQG